MSIVGALTPTVSNGQVADANTLMAMFAFIQSQVNSNACPKTAGSSVLKGDGAGGTVIATAGTDYMTPTGVQSGGQTFLTAVAGTNAITATLAGLTAYAAGNPFNFVSAGANTGGVTININGVGVKAVTKFGANTLAAGEIPAGAVISVVYDGTQFQLVGVASGSLLSGAGWARQPSGFIEQWNNGFTTSNAADVAWTFPTPFPNACVGASASYTNGGGSANVTSSFGAVGLGSIPVGTYIANTGARIAAALFMRAIGY